MRALPSNVFLIEIQGAVAYMPLNMYTQWATLGPGNRFYVSRGSRGNLSISAKRCTVLAQEIIYLD